jgi:hypothetical protein
MPNLAGHEMKGDFEPRQMMWVGYCVVGKTMNYLQALRMYDEPPHSKNIANTTTAELSTTEVDREINSNVNFSHIKEHDLLLLSHKALEIKDKHDIKRITSVEFIR